MQGTEKDKEARGVIKLAIVQDKEGQAEFVNYRKDGSAFWNFVRVMPLHTECQNVRYILGLQLDVTAFSQRLKHDYERHESRLTTIGRISTVIAHEINNPIAGVLMNLEYLHETSDLPDDVREIVDESLAEMQRVSRLLKSMLSFGRGAGRHHSDRICSLACVLEESLVMIEPMIMASGVQLVYKKHELESSNYKVNANPELVKEVILSLIYNALFSMADTEEKRLTIDCFLVPHLPQILLRISDTGIPVPDVAKAGIHEALFQQESPMVQGRTGVAAMIKRVSAFGGVLGLDEQYQQGARFLLYLPLQD